MRIVSKKIASFAAIAISGLLLSGAIISTVSANNAERTVTETKTEYINYEIKTVKDDTIEYGKTSTRTKGSYGEKTYTYSVTYKGEKEISRKLVKEEVTKKPINEVIAKGTKIIWHCVDATSFNKNPYDDNKCTSSTGEIRYVSDSQARALDPTYSPGQSGHPWYNSK